MKLQNYKYVCTACSETFKARNLPKNHYAEFLMRTKTGKIAYLFAIDDEIFSSLKSKFENMPTLKKIDISTRVAVLHQIFGITCDLASDGTGYNIGAKPVCPNCGSTDMYSWEPIYPAEIFEIDVPHVTHERWNKLSNIEKQSQIKEAIERVLADKENLGIL